MPRPCNSSRVKFKLPGIVQSCLKTGLSDRGYQGRRQRGDEGDASPHLTRWGAWGGGMACTIIPPPPRFWGMVFAYLISHNDDNNSNNNNDNNYNINNNNNYDDDNNNPHHYCNCVYCY